MTQDIPLKVGEPRDRQDVTTAHDLALNELRDHGYPVQPRRHRGERWSNGKDATMVFTAEPGPLAHFGPIEIAGNASVSDRVIQRQLTFKPGDLYRRSVVQDSQRRLYGMELFQFVNVESLNPEQQQPDVKTKVTVAEGHHQRVNLGVGYGTEEKFARRRGVSPPELSRRRPVGGHPRTLVVARSRPPARFQPAVFFQPPLLTRRRGQHWYTYTPAYRSLITGGRVSLTQQRSQAFSWSVFISSERSTSTVSDEALHDPHCTQI